MKILAIDTAMSKFTIAVKDGDKKISSTYDVGMKQSEFLLVAIDKVLSQLKLQPCDLDATAISAGPGSFTGLRLAFATCKALTLAHDIPLYPISTLDIYAHQFIETQKMQTVQDFVLPVIDAKQNKFFAKIFYDGKVILPDGDYTVLEIVDALSAFNTSTQNKNCRVIICAQDAKVFAEHAQREIALSELANTANVLEFLPIEHTDVATAIFDITEKMIAENAPVAKDYDAPIYIRASNAEEKLQQKV